MRTLAAMLWVLAVAGGTTPQGPLYLRSAETGLLWYAPESFAQGARRCTPHAEYLIDRPRPGELETMAIERELTPRVHPRFHA